MEWIKAEIISTKLACQNLKFLTFKINNFPNFIPGQHINIRIFKKGEYYERDYSFASPPSQKNIIEIGVEYFEDGEVSPILWNLKKGQKIDIRGPIGGSFLMEKNFKEPLIYIAAGSGVVPFLSMLKYNIETQKKQMLLLASYENEKKVILKKYLDKLTQINPNIKIFYTFTKNSPKNWRGLTGRINAEMLKKLVGDYKSLPIYICGSTIFVEEIAALLLNLGFKFSQLKTERFN